MNVTCAIPAVPLITFYTATRKWSLGIITNSFGMTVMSVVDALVFIWIKKQYWYELIRQLDEEPSEH